MKHFYFLVFVFLSFTLLGQGTEPTSLQPSPYNGGILKAVIPYTDPFTGQTQYIYQHDTLTFDQLSGRVDTVYRNGNETYISFDGIEYFTGDGGYQDIIIDEVGSGVGLGSNYTPTIGFTASPKAGISSGVDDQILIDQDANNENGILRVSNDSLFYDACSGCNDIFISKIATIDTDTQDLSKDSIGSSGTRIIGINLVNGGRVAFRESDNQDLTISGNVLSLTNDATSVTLPSETDPTSIKTVSGLSPLFTSSLVGTDLSFARVSQIANAFYASPNGSTGLPGFRSIVNDDLPNSAANTGTFTNATVTVNSKGIVTAASSGTAVTGESTTVTDGTYIDHTLTGFAISSTIIPQSVDSTRLAPNSVKGSELEDIVTPGTGFNLFSLDANGRVTSASTAAYLTGNQTVTLSGDVTGSGNTGITTTIASDAVTSSKILNGTIDSLDIATGIIGTTRILNESIESADIQNGTIDSLDIRSSAIGTTAILDNSIEAADLQATGVTANTYNNVTVNTKGQVTAGSNVAYLTTETGDISGVSVTSPLTGGGTSGAVTIGINTANSIQSGALSSTDWVSFNSRIAGVLGAPLTVSGTAIGINQATTSQAGFLSSADWNTFNGKLSGSGVSGRIGYYNGTNSLTSSGSFLYDGTKQTINAGSNVGTSTILETDRNGWGGFRIDNYRQSSAYGFHVTDNYSPFTTALTVNTFNGRIGVTQTTPTAKLEIGGLGDGDGLKMTRSSVSGLMGVNSQGDIILQSTTGFLTIGDNSTNFATINPSASIHLFAPTGAGSNDMFKFEKAGGNGSTVFRQYFNSGTDYGFRLGDGYTTANYMSINHFNGNVGFGIAAPLKRVHVSGNVRISDLDTDGTTPTQSGALRMVTTDGNGDLGFATIPTTSTIAIDSTTTTTADNSTKVYGYTVGGNRVTSLINQPLTWAGLSGSVVSWGSSTTFNSGKNVGIGTTGPSRLLDVNGDMRSRGAIYNSANSAGTSGQVLTSQGTGAWTWTTPFASSGVSAGTGINVSGSSSTVTITNAGVTSAVAGSGINVSSGTGAVTISANMPWVSGYGNTTSNTIAASTTATYNIQNSLNNYTSNYTVSTANDDITVLSAGDYEVSFEMSAVALGGALVSIEDWDGTSWTSFPNLTGTSYFGATTAGNITGFKTSVIGTLSANNKIRVRIQNFSSTNSLDYYRGGITIKKIK